MKVEKLCVSWTECKDKIVGIRKQTDRDLGEPISQ